MSYSVSNPYVATTHPYPTRYHGGVWTRPVFGFPRMTAVQSVFKSDDFNDCNPALRGLGDVLVDNANGVFGTAKSGGGVFGPSLYGLGAACPLPAVCEEALRSASQYFNTSILDGYCEATPENQNAIYTVCNQAIAAAAKGGAPAAPTSFTTDQVKSLQTMLNAALVAAGYNALSVDGKLGPGTCGAIKWYRAAKGMPAAGASFDPICATKGSNPPTRRASAAPAPAPVPDASPGLQASVMPSAGTLAMIGGGLLAVTLAVVGKKKGWF